MRTEAVRQFPIAGTLAILGIEAFVVDYRPALAQTAHRHSHASITLVLRGDLEEDSGGRSQHVSPLIAIAKAKDTVHTSRYGARGCSTLQVNFSSEFEFAAAGLSPLESGRYEGGRLVPALLRVLAEREWNSATFCAGTAICEALAELSGSADAHSVIPKWLERAKDAIDCADPTEQLSVLELSRIASVHPVHLTRQFKRHYGCTTRDYGKKRRLHAAVRVVAEGELPLGTIAHRFGYSDQAHFCRAFLSVAGLPARTYRRLIASFDAAG